MEFKKVYTEFFNDPEVKYRATTDLFRYKWVEEFLRWQDADVSSLLDVGSGRGVLPQRLEFTSSWLKITTLDLDKFHDAHDLSHVNADLSTKEGQDVLRSQKADVVACLDMLEHLTYESAEAVIEAMSQVGKYAVFTIANHSGMYKEHQMHIIQESERWWREKLAPYYKVLKFQYKYNGILYAYWLESKAADNLALTPDN